MKVEKYLERYNLDGLSESDLGTVIEIASELCGTGAMKMGMLFSGKTEDVTKCSLLSAQVQQNWIIINQLSRISNKLDHLIEK